MKNSQYISIIILCFVMLVGCTPDDSSSPVPEDIFVKHYGEGGLEAIVDIQPYNDGFLIFGSTDINGTTDFYLIYTDNSGNEISKKIVSAFDPAERVSDAVTGAIVSSQPSKMLIHNDGSGDIVSLVGTSTITLFQGELSISRMSVVNFDPLNLSDDSNNGLRRVYPSFSDINFTNITNQSDISDTINYLARFNSEGADLIKQGDDLVILGTTEDVSDKGLVNGDDPKDMWLIRVPSDLSGDIIWQRKYGFPGEDVGVAIELNSTGYSIVGSTEQVVDGNGGNNVLYYPTDFDGFSGPANLSGTQVNDIPSDLILSGGRPIIVGTRSNGNAFIKSIGAPEISVTVSDQNLSNITGSQDDGSFVGNSANSIIQLQNGNFFVVGQVTSFVSNGTNKNAEMIMYITDQFGLVDSTSVQTFGGIGSDQATAVFQNTDGSLIIGGTTDFQGNTTLMTLLKTDSKGKLVK